jgi:hypothetical protein
LLDLLDRTLEENEVPFLETLLKGFEFEKRWQSGKNGRISHILLEKNVNMMKHQKIYTLFVQKGCFFLHRGSEPRILSFFQKPPQSILSSLHSLAKSLGSYAFIPSLADLAQAQLDDLI